jgi:multiple sugar transport system permease protein
MSTVTRLRRGGSVSRRQARAGIALVSPSVIIVLVLVVLPILWTVMLAFQDVRLIQIRRVNLFGNYTIDNFVSVIASEALWSSLGTTLAYSVLGTGGAIVVGLVAALALRNAFRGRTLVRAAMLLPYVSPVVAAAFVWKTMLNPQFGVANAWGTGALGWDQPISFLTTRTSNVEILGLALPVPTALFTVIAFEIWRTFPFVFLFVTARLQAVPKSIEEAARMDGAVPTQMFRHILLPQLLPTIAVLSVLRFIWTFNNFDDVYLLTGGGAGTEVVSVGVFNYLIGRGDIGSAAAQALVLAAILTVMVLIYMKFAVKDEEVA